MKAKVRSDQSFEFYFPDLDTQLRVEAAADKVLIRTPRNSLSDRRQLSFFRHLVAEGFIPNRYQSVSDCGSDWSQVCWPVDTLWLQLHKSNTFRTCKFMPRLLTSAVRLWLGLRAAAIMEVGGDAAIRKAP